MIVESYNILDNLITLKIEKRFRKNGKIDYVRIRGHFGDNYSESKFFKSWNSHSPHKPLFALAFVFYDCKHSVNKDIISMSQEKYFINNSLMYRKCNIRMCEFYVYPNHNYEHSLTCDEYNLFKGIGRNTLLWVLENMNEFNGDCNMIVEASGGNDENDMENLTKYYKKIGFYPISEDNEYLCLGYSEFHVVMMGKIHEITHAIKNYIL